MSYILFHVKHLLFLPVLFFYMNAKSQGYIRMEDKTIIYNIPEDSSLRRMLVQSNDYNKLSTYDQQVAYYLNYARKNPQVFLDKAINVFVANHPEIKSSYIASLQVTYKTLQPLGIIYPDFAISKVSMAHAVDLRMHNIISHSSTDGRSFQDRVSSVIKECASESIHASMRYNPLEAILSLLFDFNVPDLGHRKSLLDKRFTKGGFGSSVVPNQYSVLVMDFSCK